MNFFLLNFCLLLSFVLARCNKDQAIVEIPSQKSHNSFTEGRKMGAPENDLLIEVSGIAVSRSNHNFLWAHNDSRHPAELYLMTFTGEDRGKITLKNGRNRDWEDMAIGPGPVEGINYIYIGDIGDNNAKYEIKDIYRFPEPDVSQGEFPVNITIKKFDKIRYIYPDGRRDAETLMVDPFTRDIYIISKREPMVSIYKATYPQSLTEVITLDKVGTLDLNNVVAGDISADGMEILIKTYTDIYYWQRRNGEKVEETLKRTPKRLPYTPEPQGEAIAWHPKGLGYFTLSEKKGEQMPYIFYYERK
jgi:hypothetical protein